MDDAADSVARHAGIINNSVIEKYAAHRVSANRVCLSASKTAAPEDAAVNTRTLQLKAKPLLWMSEALPLAFIFQK